jgi:Protein CHLORORESPIRATORY REDUCTION 7
MPDSIMYHEDAFIVLESDKPEIFMTAEELKAKLQQALQSPDIDMPRELTKFDSVEQQAQHLIDNYFELDIGDGKYLQWYVVRLEK